ncbi:MAG: hypothetical protein IMW94_10530 [Thermoanaerobacter sp.]|nr:hypothetical protein [Thermoanaerobacter sp.]
MAVIVKAFRVRAGEKTYFPGETINGLDPRVEQKLVSEGYCEYPVRVQVEEPLAPDTGSTENPVTPEEDGPATDHPLVQGGKKKK